MNRPNIIIGMLTETLMIPIPKKYKMQVEKIDLRRPKWSARRPLTRAPHKAPTHMIETKRPQMLNDAGMQDGSPEEFEAVQVLNTIPGASTTLIL
jgi:hypothetical protein